MFSYTSDGAKDCVVTRTFGERQTKEVVCDYNLPDYLPDVSRILRTDARVCRAGKYINGSALEYDGTLDFRVVYSTSDGVLKSAEFSSDYSGSMMLSDYSGDCRVDADTTLESAGCRLQNPRKLTVKAKVLVSAEISCAKCTAPVMNVKLTQDEERGIQYKNETLDVCFRITASDPDIALGEDAEIPQTLPAASEIVAVSLDPSMTEIRAGDGVISYRGAVLARVLYAAAQEDESIAPEYYCFSKKFSVSGEAAAEGVSPSCFCTGTLCVTDASHKLSPNAEGEMRTVELDATYTAYLDAFCNAKSEVTTDMYSTHYESDTETEELSYRTAVAAKTFNTTQSVCAEAADEFTGVVCASASASVTDAEKSGGKMIFSGTANVAAILRSDDGVYTGRTFSAPFRAEADVANIPDDYEFSAVASVLDVSCRHDGEKLCADVEIAVSYVIFANRDVIVASKLAIAKDRPRTSRLGAGVTLYYPSRSDTLWEISKKYGVTCAELCALNDIQGEAPSDAVLMIPRKKRGNMLV